MISVDNQARVPDAQMESSEARDRRYKQLFERLDIQHSGAISLSGFRKSVKDLDHPIKDSKDAVEEIFQSLDNHNLNAVDFDSFKEYLIRAETQIIKGFHNLDKDQDGIINQNDVKNYLEGLGVEANDKQVEQFFNRLDTKHDGVITYDEFRDTLLLMPRLSGSRVKTAYKFISSDLENVSSDGDFTVGEDILNSIGYFLAGGLSGKITSSVGELKHQKIPIDKIKSPILKAATSIYRQGGLRGFYVGNGLNVLKVFPESAMKFGSFEAAKRFMCTVEGVSDPTQLSKVSTFAAGGFGGVCAQMTVYPIDTLKYRLQCAKLDSDIRGNRLLWTTAKQMYKEGGLRIFYRGLYVGIIGMFPYAAIDLGTFSTLKKWYFQKEAVLQNCAPEDVKLPNYIVLSMGALSGTIGASMVYPVNLIRTRLQAQGTYAHPHRYNGFFDAARKTMVKEGVPGLFKGLLPNLAKVAPAVSISYLMYENLKDLFQLE
ncbi:putative transporter, member of the Ca2+-binding subfamily of the mitochondrial carrier family [Komagataella phaffii GS115]|uniref:Probable transporter, member of the Ca2+-binding subfamily of the mitochondrial carrier family n=1 Tax=Komagataella phaffii (strain GS115 / ATCC 20864) TaxID=644223 RepID=C4R6X4_KOMPG|nr:putative transporter, member of the Ca2+-binding subfamily of the mitochondrial carrier family [Komagataella phaffii GS115]CAY71349.1 Probable transporter, member of the Ca2+-binding subfamily of the mitochondrial carrier family [Komagataella phaffii GS115]